jgi:peptidoglycan/LPS O-acetylase OafA/YrhL
MHFIIIKLVAAQWEAVADKPFVLFAISAVVSVVYAVFIDRWIDPVFRRRGRSTPDTSARKATLSDLPQQR